MSPELANLFKLGLELVGRPRVARNLMRRIQEGISVTHINPATHPCNLLARS